MREITINTSALSGDINELRGALASAKSQLEEMFGHVRELDAMWDGPANEAFNRQFVNDYENAKQLCQTVEEMLNCMEFAKNQYDLCENEVGGIVSAIAI